MPAHAHNPCRYASIMKIMSADKNYHSAMWDHHVLKANAAAPNAPLPWSIIQSSRLPSLRRAFEELPRSLRRVLKELPRSLRRALKKLPRSLRRAL